MRSIETREIVEKKEKRRARLISALLLLILVGSTAGYAFLSNTATNTSTPAEQNPNGQWSASFEGQDLLFSSSPNSTKDIQAPYITINQYAGKPLYIVSDSEAISNEIASTLGRYTSRVQKACYLNCKEDLPEKDCTENLIIWNQSEDNKIYQQDSCIFIDGDLRAVDAFLYKVFDIK
ncbi:hypothetical protein KW787_02605 [Candidatus Pacearchaeota archaeon]|nr:hypothetical protein [Candidatus Pacearchaeota archaeon]